MKSLRREEAILTKLSEISPEKVGFKLAFGENLTCLTAHQLRESLVFFINLVRPQGLLHQLTEISLSYSTR